MGTAYFSVSITSFHFSLFKPGYCVGFRLFPNVGNELMAKFIRSLWMVQSNRASFNLSLFSSFITQFFDG